MAMLNYSVPFAAAAAATPAHHALPQAFYPQHQHGLEGLATASAVNNFLYTNDPYHAQRQQRQQPPPPLHRQPAAPARQHGYAPTSSPSRRGAAARDPRDPYRNQVPAQYYEQQAQQARQLPQLPQVPPPPQLPPLPQVQHQQQQQPAVAGATRYTRVDTGAGQASPRAKTTLHAVIDYDDDFAEDEYYDDEEAGRGAPQQAFQPSRQPLGQQPLGQQPLQPAVTPIQGPIYAKNGSVPVVPLFSYPVRNNGSYVQIPILWTALSLALGLEIRGEVIRGVPCIKRFHQLFCPTAGNSYPIERIERFIDDNKSLMRRMYGEFQMTTEYGPPAREVFETPASTTATGPPGGVPPGVPSAPPPGVPGGGGRRRSLAKREAEKNNDATPPDPVQDAEKGNAAESFFGKIRSARQSFRNNQSQSETGRVDACESKVEIVTPYWASNSAGKIRAIVNTQHFEQAIHQEVCAKPQTKRCTGDCGCEQKYKWHRLLAYDPDNDCKGIFMDWFLFPSCCVCRCNP